MKKPGLLIGHLLLHLLIVWAGAVLLFVAVAFNPGGSEAKENAWLPSLLVWAVGAAVLSGLAFYYRLSRKNIKTYWRIVGLSVVWPLLVLAIAMSF